MAYDWPGNVLHLRNVIEQALVFGSAPLIDVPALPDTISRVSASDSAPREEAQRLRAFTEAMIDDALAKSQGNQAEAARVLSLSPRLFAAARLRFERSRVDSSVSASDSASPRSISKVSASNSVRQGTDPSPQGTACAFLASLGKISEAAALACGTTVGKVPKARKSFQAFPRLPQKAGA